MVDATASGGFVASARALTSISSASFFALPAYAVNVSQSAVSVAASTHGSARYLASSTT
jgi:hypothetical protein